MIVFLNPLIYEVKNFFKCRLQSAIFPDTRLNYTMTPPLKKDTNAKVFLFEEKFGSGDIDNIDERGVATVLHSCNGK